MSTYERFEDTPVWQAAADLALDLDRGWMVGDQARDILAGRLPVPA